MIAIKVSKKNPWRKKTVTSNKSSVVKTKKTSEKISSSERKNIKNIKNCNHIDWLQKSDLLFQLNPAAIALFSLPDGKCIDVNEASLKMTGFTREELIGKTDDDIKIFADTKEKKKAFKELLERGHFKDYELKIRRKDGKIMDGLFSSEVVEHKGKKYIIAIMIDLTSHKLAEKAKNEKEEKYRTILETTEEGYYEIDLAGNFTFFNDPVCKLLGYSRKELMGMNNRSYTDKETAKKVFQAFNKVYRTGTSTKEFDWQIIRKDGTKRYIEQSASLQKDSAGKPIGFRGIFHDITERKQMEYSLIKSEENFRHSIDDSPLGVRIVTSDGETIFANKAVLDIYGYNNIDELKNTPLRKRYTAESYTNFKEFLATKQC